MERTKIILSGLWVALMFTYLLGDVLRVYSGDVKPGELFGQSASQLMYLGIAVFMFVPILMIILNLLLSGNLLRWLNLIEPQPIPDSPPSQINTLSFSDK